MFGNLLGPQNQGLQGFGAASPEQVDALLKALTAGSDIAIPGSFAPGDGFALRVESLEQTAILTSYGMENIRFWKAVPKQNAYNIIEEHNVLSSYGTGDDAFIAEGAKPGEEDSTWERKTAQVKFLGTTRKVTHPMSLINPAHGNVVAQEQVNGMMWLLGAIERALFTASSALSSLQFDGLSKLISDNSPAGNIIDMRGQPLDEDRLVEGALILNDDPNFGVPSDVWISPKAHVDIVRTFFPKERYDVFKKDNDGNIGLDVGGFISPAGRVKFQTNTFIRDGGAPPSTATQVQAGNSPNVPGSPTISTGATTPVEATAQFAADDAGDYEYWVTANNDRGHSAAVSVGAAVTVAAGDKVTFGVTPAGGASPATKWFEIFRTKKGGTGIGNARRILRVANGAGAGESILNDLNAVLPFCTEAYMLEQNKQVLSVKQLAPFFKVPFAITELAMEWAQGVYMVPVLKAPRKVLKYINVGRSPGSIGT